MNHSILRRSLPIIAIYAVMCVVWAAFAYWVAPDIVTAAYQERSLRILNWVFQGHRSNPVEHYLDLWRNLFAGAVVLGAILHLAIVLVVVNTHYKNRVLLPNATKEDPRTISVLIIYSAAFLAVSILGGASRSHYAAYLIEWTDVLTGRDPWQLGRMDPGVPYNAYGPLFNLLAPLTIIHPLFSKLLLAGAYIGFMVWLTKVRSLTIYSPVLLFVLLNPLPWLVVAHDGPFDGAVGIACVMAVYCLEQGKDRGAGVWLAAGALLKFSPLLVLPFLAFDNRRFRARFVIWATMLIVGGMVLSVLAWGPSTFNPLIFAGTRHTEESIYDVIFHAMAYADRMNLPIRFAWEAADINRLPTLSLAIAGLGMFAWCAVFRPAPALATFMAILTTLTFYRMGYLQYQMTLFCITSYWAASEWREIKGCRTLVSLLIGYFSIVGVLALIEWGQLELTGWFWYFLLGMRSTFAIALLLALMRISALNRFEASRPVSA